MSSVTIKLDRFDSVKGKAVEGLKKGILGICMAVQQQAKYNIVGVDAVDTSAMLNSVYVDAPGLNERDEAIARAMVAAATDGVHSGRPHEFTEAEQVTKISPGTLKGKVGVAAEYGAFIELGVQNAESRPFLLPAAVEVAGEASNIASEFIKREIGQ
ncbi:MAG: hypothetical protein ABL962_18855 [Fimbriimonadaceae bacterium]